MNASEISVKVKVNNEIITNIDIDKEYQYLISLNKNLQNVENKIIFDLAKNSLINETIKEKELEKLITIDQENNEINEIIKSIYSNIGFNNKEEFENYLYEKNLNYKEVENKIRIEFYWNQLIYSKFKDQIIIEEKKIREKVNSNLKKQNLVELSEIILSIENKNEINLKLKEITKSIDEIGFEKTALLFSDSISKNNNGYLGWINKNALSKEILVNIDKIDLNQITEPIYIPSGVLLLKLHDAKSIEENIDTEKEVKNIINSEINTQLNNFSNIYFLKVKNNFEIHEK